MDIAVFDTNILIDFSRQNADAQNIIRRIPQRLISVVTWVEFLTGIPEPNIEEAKSFLNDTFEVVETNFSTYEQALDLRRAMRLKLPDALIYAAAKENDIALITRNRKDFKPDWKDIHIPYDI